MVVSAFLRRVLLGLRQMLHVPKPPLAQTTPILLGIDARQLAHRHEPDDALVRDRGAKKRFGDVIGKRVAHVVTSGTVGSSAEWMSLTRFSRSSIGLEPLLGRFFSSVFG